MKKLILLVLYVFATANINALLSQESINTNKLNVIYKINKVPKKWNVRSDRYPDRLKVYCPDAAEAVSVSFITEDDSISFNISNNDTVRFNIIVKNTDTVLTEIVGDYEIPKTYSQEERLIGLSRLWSEVKYNFMNYDNLDFDLDSLYGVYLTKVSGNINDFEYYQALKSFMSCLNDGHSEVYDGGQFYIYQDYIPFTIKYIEGKFFIISFREDLSDKIAIGDEIKMINGISTDDYLKKNILPFISASTLQHKLSIASNRITYGLKSDSMQFELVDTLGRLKVVILARNGESTRYDYQGKEKYKRMSVKHEHKRNMDVSYTEDSIAILTYNRFYPDFVISDFENVLPDLCASRGVIIDLRDNPGGSTKVAKNLLSHIIKEDHYYGLAAETKINDAVYKSIGYGDTNYRDYYNLVEYRQEISDTIQIPDSVRRIKSPIVILVNENTFSAAEDFLIMLYEIKDRPLIIGHTTGGSTGLPLVIESLPGGGWARICARRCIFPISKMKFVNTGIVPDITIQSTLNDVLLNRDKILEKGIEVIRDKIE